MRKGIKSAKILGLILITAILSTLVLLPVTSGLASGTLTVHMLKFDGGRNDCFIIQLPNSQKMVIDTSNHTALINKLTDLGISQIKYLVGTHEHIDHIGGFNNFLNADFPINNTQIYYVKGALNATSDHYNWMVSAANSYNGPPNNSSLSVTKLKQGDYILNTTYDGKVLQIKVLSPEASRVDGIGTNDYTDENDASLVLKITYGNRSIIFMGDARSDTEAHLLQSCPNDLQADVIKVGHHGIEKQSEYPLSDDFLDAVQPTKLLITNGDDGVLSPRMLQNIYDRNISYWSNGDRGYVMLQTDGTNDWVADSAPSYP